MSAGSVLAESLDLSTEVPPKPESKGGKLAESLDLSPEIPLKPESKGGKVLKSAAITAGAGLGFCVLGAAVASISEQSDDYAEAFEDAFFIYTGCGIGAVHLGVAALLALVGGVRKAHSGSKRRQWEKEYGKFVSNLNISLQLPMDESRRTQVFVGVNF